MERVRTPDSRFVDLVDFDFEVRYAEVHDPNGGEPLRMAFVDEGPSDAQPVVLLHGEPTWSYLYRHMIPILVAAGHRVIAPDLIGFGRSDKPTLKADYTYARHVEWTRELLLDRLSLGDVTLFGQDWGSLIGLRLVAEHPERFARVCIANGGLPTGDLRLGDAFDAWREFSQSVAELPVGAIVAGGCVTRLVPEVVAAYDAPYPDETFKAGARQFPALVPNSPDDPGHNANVAAWRVLEEWPRPFLCCFSDGDPITRGADRIFVDRVRGAKGQSHSTIVGGGHFIQEDCGAELAAVVCAFIATT
jgi:haloalkane dehalogenase